MKIEIIRSGRNNLVSKIYYKKKMYVYKKYLKSDGNGIKYSRYDSETSFINLLRKKRIIVGEGPRGFGNFIGQNLTKKF